VRRGRQDTEGTLWLELADAEERFDELRKRVQNHLNANRLDGESSGQTNFVKGLDSDDPEARQRFIQGEL
jgi:hypothetical protein